MSQVYFITGTDTNAGKTFVCTAIMETLKQQGKSVIGLKPVAAGAELIDNQLKNDDALELIKSNSIALDYHLVNPNCFPEAIAPHIAAEKNKVEVTLNQVSQQLKKVITGYSNVDAFFIEGAGGWLVPLNKTESFSDIPKVIEAKVILVVGMKLGCINHARLSAQSVLSQGVELVGWIANQLAPDMPVYQDNLATLTALMPCPLIGELKYNQTVFKKLSLPN